MYSNGDTAYAVGCPIRIFPDQSLLAAPQDFSQPVTSFIASRCQGIHQMPLRRLILSTRRDQEIKIDTKPNLIFFPYNEHSVHCPFKRRNFTIYVKFRPSDVQCIAILLRKKNLLGYNEEKSSCLRRQIFFLMIIRIATLSQQR